MNQMENETEKKGWNLKSVLGKGALWLASLVIAGVIGGYVTMRYETSLQDRQQRIDQIDHFRESGAALDSAWQLFNDALVDHHDIEDARRALRTAIASHSSAAFGMSDILGPEATKRYMSSLAQFRDEVDRTTDPTDAMPMAQSALNIISDRDRLVKGAGGG